MRIMHVPTRGMKCSACSRLVEQAVLAIAGVISVTSSDEESMTSVMYDEKAGSEHLIAEAIRGAGFEPEQPV